ncbi:MAG: cache domain-containing protein [Rhodocyclaceae bacterium]|nr:cache domain-containing protein [Rhodocyclaceae bacterium]
MTFTRLSLVTVALVATLVAGFPAHAAGDDGIYGSSEQARADALLDRAAAHVARLGIAGVHAFSRQAEFVDRDLYVYALDINGRFLASGGASAVLIGDNVLDEVDVEGKPFFREIVDIARRDGEGRITYRWFNPADSSGEPKLTSFRRVGDIIVAVGYYPPRATPAQARRLLARAGQALAGDPNQALAEFQRLNGPFVRDDLYVFVVDVASGRFLAHGASPVLVGSDGRQLRDPDGRPVVTEMLDRAARSGDGELDYIWRNPVTGKLEHKHTYFTVSGGRLIGVGYYTR